jgi:hypothetical protein
MANTGRGRNAAKARGCRPVCKGVTRWLKNPVFQGRWDDQEIWLIDTDKNTTSKIVDGGGDHFGPIAWAPDGKRFASSDCPTVSVRSDSGCELKCSMRRRGKARRYCRIFDWLPRSLPSPGHRMNRPSRERNSSSPAVRGAPMHRAH